VEAVMKRHANTPDATLGQIIGADAWARAEATALLAK
jgi:hypothetical protein